MTRRYKFIGAICSSNIIVILRKKEKKRNVETNANSRNENTRIIRSRNLLSKSQKSIE